MRALKTNTWTATCRHQLCFIAATSLLAIAVVLASRPSTSHAYGPELKIENFAAHSIGYYDMYDFEGYVKNVQGDPTDLTVTIYIEGQPAGTCTPLANGFFSIQLQCVGGDVTALTYESPFYADATIRIL